MFRVLTLSLMVLPALARAKSVTLGCTTTNIGIGDKTYDSWDIPALSPAIATNRNFGGKVLQ